MRVLVKKWGNSASVRIPASVMQAVRLQLDDAVEVREEGGRIVIEPLRVPAYDLVQLLDGITPANLHSENYHRKHLNFIRSPTSSASDGM